MEPIENLNKWTLEKSVEQAQLNLVEELQKRGVEEAVEAVTEPIKVWAATMKKKYPETYSKTRSYVAALNGSVGPEQTLKDFEGEDSIFVPLRELRKKLLPDTV